MDLALHVAALDRRYHAPLVVDPRDVGEGFLFDAVGEALDAIGPAQRVDGPIDAGFQCDHLLRAQCEGGGLLAGKRQRFVEGIGVQGLGAAEHGRQRLECGPHNIDVGLLCGQARASRLGVETHLQRARILGRKALPHDLGVQAPGGAELGDLLEKVAI